MKAILQYLAATGVVAWRMNTGAVSATYQGKPRFVRFGVKGMSDIIGLIPPSGRLLAVEVKRPEGKPTPEQTQFLAAVVRAGGIAFLARSVKDVQEHGL